MFELPKYLKLSEETYASSLPFAHLVNLVKFLALEHEALNTDDLLVIELPDGVFIKTTDNAWDEMLAEHATTPEGKPGLQKIDGKKWNDVTTRYRAPKDSFGNEKLARWRVGF